MTSKVEVEAVAGKGLQGDRFFRSGETDSDPTDEGTQVTLVQIEAIERVAAEVGGNFTSADSRRNIATRGIDLNDLVGREFCVGGARLRGVELCEPCAHMTQTAGPRALRNLVHRGGLRAAVVSGGMIRVGDAVGSA
jgi:MOSC domain-containing protein YiiM